MAQRAVNDLESGYKTIYDEDNSINSVQRVGKWLHGYSKAWEFSMLEDGAPVSTGPSVLIASTTSGFHTVGDARNGGVRKGAASARSFTRHMHDKKNLS